MVVEAAKEVLVTVAAAAEDAATQDGAADAPLVASNGVPRWYRFTPKEVDAGRCLVRTWAAGRGGQCSRVRVTECGLCKMCSKKEVHVHGLVTGDIPEAKWKEFVRVSGVGRAPVTGSAVSAGIAKGHRHNPKAVASDVSGPLVSAIGRKRGHCALRPEPVVDDQEKVSSQGSVGHAGDAARRAAKRPDAASGSMTSGGPHGGAAGALVRPQSDTSPHPESEGGGWSGVARGAAVRSLRGRRAQLRAQESGAAADAEMWDAEASEDEGERREVGGAAGTQRDPVRSARAAATAEKRLADALRVGGVSEPVASNLPLRAQAEDLLGRLKEKYEVLGRKEDAKALTLGRGLVTKARVEKLKAMLESMRK